MTLQPVSSPIIVAAFEPFGGRRRNRALDAARLLRGERVGERAIEQVTLPVSFAALPAIIDTLLDRAPELLLLVGESASTRRLLVERIAVNVAHARIPDNAGARPIDEQLVTNGPAALTVAFDPRRLANAAIAAGCPAEVSAHAGTFCCNAALYHALRKADDAQGNAARRPRVAFVHVPARFPWARDHRSAHGLLAIARTLVSLS